MGVSLFEVNRTAARIPWADAHLLGSPTQREEVAMKVFGVTQSQLREVLDSLDLWAEDMRHFPKGGCGFSVRPKGDRYRVDPMSPDDDYFVVCQHGHAELILALLRQGATVYTVLAKYGPHLLKDGRWERKQEEVVRKHRQRFPTHQACHCDREKAVA